MPAPGGRGTCAGKPVKKYLERLGYQVDACTHPDAALKLLDENPQRYGLLVTDLTLPEMNGEELVLRSRERTPQLRAIIASGYPYESRTTGVEFLQKPFQPAVLAQAVVRILKS